MHTGRQLKELRASKVLLEGRIASRRHHVRALVAPLVETIRLVDAIRGLWKHQGLGLASILDLLKSTWR